MTEPAASPPKRAYESPLRADQARQTRRRIRAAATARFLADGYKATSMDAIAKAAGVSRQTVFSAFGSKAMLLKEIIDVGLAGDDEPVPVIEREPAQRMFASEDAEEVLRLFAGVACRVGRGVLPVWALYEEAAAQEPAIAEMLAAGHAARRAEMDGLVAKLRSLDALGARWTDREVADLLATFSGPHPASELLDLGWSWDDVERLLADTLVALLLDPS